MYCSIVPLPANELECRNNAWFAATAARGAGLRPETLNRIEQGKHSASVAAIDILDRASAQLSYGQKWFPRERSFAAVGTPAEPLLSRTYENAAKKGEARFLNELARIFPVYRPTAQTTRLHWRRRTASHLACPLY